MVRNIAGDVTSITDALDITYTGVYDAVGRIRSVSYAGASSPITAYSYVAGRSDALLASMVDASGSTAWTYDSAGRALSKQQITDGTSLTASIIRDPLGRPGTVVYPSGMRLGITYSGDTVAALTINGTLLLSNINYLPFSQVATGWRWGNGSSYARAIDADGRVTAVSLGSVQRSYGYDTARRITRQIDVSSLGTKTGALAYDEAALSADIPAADERTVGASQGLGPLPHQRRIDRRLHTGGLCCHVPARLASLGLDYAV